MTKAPFTFLAFQLAFIAGFTGLFLWMGWWAVPVICVVGAIGSSILLHVLLKTFNPAIEEN